MSEEVLSEVRVPLRQEDDVLVASQHGRVLTSQLNFSSSERTGVTIAVSEVARNIVQYAGQGEIILRLIVVNDRRAVVVVASDTGPGIPDIEKAMQDGYSTGGGLGTGLPGAKRLMDEFEITTEVGKGTTIVMKKWEKTV